VLLGQTLVFGVCLENYVPRCPRDACHAFLLMTGICEWGVTSHQRTIALGMAASRGNQWE
jgi:hypothetical protein